MVLLLHLKVRDVSIISKVIVFCLSVVKGTIVSSHPSPFNHVSKLTFYITIPLLQISNLTISVYSKLLFCADEGSLHHGCFISNESLH